jgi:hypothetical protein
MNFVETGSEQLAGRKKSGNQGFYVIGISETVFVRGK